MKQTRSLTLLPAIFYGALLMANPNAIAQDKAGLANNSRPKPGKLQAVRTPAEHGASRLTGGYLAHGPSELRFYSGPKKWEGYPTLPPLTDSTKEGKPPTSDSARLGEGKSNPSDQNPGEGHLDVTKDDSATGKGDAQKKGDPEKRDELTLKKLVPYFQRGRPPQHGASGLVSFRPPVKEENPPQPLAPQTGPKK